MILPESLQRKDLESLEGAAVETHLNRTGWSVTNRAPEFSVWTKTVQDGRTVAVLVPLDSSVADYAERMDDALQGLVMVERRSARDVLRGLTTTRVDAFHARLVTSDERTSLPLSLGALAFQGIRDLFLYAALAETRGPQPFYSRPGRNATIRLLRHAELGQTAEGSFVINVAAPFPMMLLPPPGQPDARRVMSRLARSLGAVAKAAEEATDASYLAHVAEGVSANLCAALGKISASKRIRRIEFSWDWSKDIESNHLPRELSFTHDAIRQISAAGRALKKVKPQPCVVSGRVKILHHKEQDAGYVTIEQTPPAPRVRIFLSGDEHRQAIRAYGTQDLVTCSGELIQRGKEGFLVRASGFTVVPGRTS